MQKAVAAQLYNEQGFAPWMKDPRSPIGRQIGAAGGAAAFPRFIDPKQFLDQKQGAYGVPGAVMNYADVSGALGKPGDVSQETQIRVPGGGMVTVNKTAAAAFSGFLGDLAATGYRLGDVEGFNPRTKRGGSGWSEHAYGAAIDINPAANPQGGTTTDLPANIHELAAARGLIWGGDWKGSTYDPMHFQWGGPGLGAQGAPAQVTGGPPVSGSVDVTVKHVNPPPGATVTASGTGDVNLEAPRVEQQNFSWTN